MAKPQNAFDVTLKEKAVTGSPGILDQLDLPPAWITFLQENQRKIWTVISITAAVVIVVVLYGSYQDYRMNKAVLAYDKAMIEEDNPQKTAALQKIIKSYGSSPSATWSRIALAHLEQDAGNTEGAIKHLTSLDNELTKKDVLRPLILVNLGGLYEQKTQFDKAEKTYLELKEIKGFESMALESLGRVYEALGDTAKAVDMYQQYIGLSELAENGTGGGSGPVSGQGVSSQDMVRASLNRLLQ